MDATGGGTANGTAVQQWSLRTGATNQQWQFQPTDSGYYKVVTGNAPTVAWDVTGGSGATGDGVTIQLWTYGGGTNQQWRPVPQSDGNYTFTPRSNSGRVPGRHRRLHRRRRPPPAVDLHRWRAQSLHPRPQS